MDKRKDIYMITGREIKRYQSIRKVLYRQINQQEASEVLKLSERQVRRIVERVRIEGEGGVIHRLRGCSGNRLSASTCAVGTADRSDRTFLAQR